MGINLTYTYSGPLVDGRLEQSITSAMIDIEEEVAERGAELVRQNFDRVLKHPTGYLRSQVQVSATRHPTRVHNGDVIYRFWIEGTGRRNRTTRFKGYRTFRLVTQQLQAEAGQIAKTVLERIAGVKARVR